MRLSKTAMIAALSGAIAISSLSPASARDSGAVWAAGIGGFVLGGLLASQARPYHYYYYRGAPRVYYYGGPPVYYYGYGQPVYRYYRHPAYSSAIAYCMRRFKSYDARSMTYRGYDGRRHSCP